MESQAQATSLAFVNGKLVHVDEVKANYDGKHLAIDMNENGQHFSKILNNKDIQRILTQPANKLALEHRLQRDFLSTRKKGAKGKKKNSRKGKKKNSRKGKKSIKKNKV